jgi:hypothetical protein
MLNLSECIIHRNIHLIRPQSVSGVLSLSKYIVLIVTQLQEEHSQDSPPLPTTTNTATTHPPTHTSVFLQLWRCFTPNASRLP